MEIERLTKTHRLHLDPVRDAEHLWGRYLAACDGEERRARPLFMRLGEAILERSRRSRADELLGTGDGAGKGKA
jgi:hypothetical protein